MDKVTMIKKDAIAEVKIGSGFLQMLQRVLLHLVENKSTEDLETFKSSIEDYEKNKIEFSEDWMDSVYTITVLIKEIENSFINNDGTYEEPLSPITSDEN